MAFPDKMFDLCFLGCQNNSPHLNNALDNLLIEILCTLKFFLLKFFIHLNLEQIVALG